MPYIKGDERKRLEADAGINLFGVGSQCKTAGELNYTITRILIGYYHTNGGKYQQVNDIIGALEGAKLEFYRKVVANYEDLKISENGDVY